MAFKKGPAQAKKSGPKGAVEAKRKAPPTKKPLSANLDEDDDDLDEEDDDFSVDEDSDLSGADEELDDEELDDEELDDEELDEESGDEEPEDEGVPAPKAKKQESAATKAQGQQQKSPVKQPPQTPKDPVVAAVNGKRKAEFEGGSSPAKRIRLEDHIPPSFVIDYETRDLCDVKLTSFADGVTKDDVKKLCKDGTVVREVQQNDKLVCAYVRYATKEKAVAASRSLQGASLKGVAIKASYCGDRWDNPATRPQFQTDLLDVRHVPREYLDKEKLAALFPTGEVLKVHRDGYAQVKFPSNEALIKALKDPKCWTINNQDLEFAVALVPRQKRNKPEASKTGQNAVFSPKNNKAKKGSPQTPVQRKQKQKRSKTPGQQGGPNTPGQQGGPKTPGQQRGRNTPGQQGGRNTPGQQGRRNTPGQQGARNTPGQQGGRNTPGRQKGPKTPGQQKGPKTPGQQKGPKTPGQQRGPKTPGQQRGPKTPGQQRGPKTPGQQRGPKTPGQAKGGAKTPKGTPRQKTPGMKETPAIA